MYNMEHKLIAFYEKRLTVPEQQEVEEWLARDPEHQKIYADTITIWKHSGVEQPFRMMNKQKAWERLQQQIDLEEGRNIKSKPVLVGWRLLAAAASVALLAALFIVFRDPRPQQFDAVAEQRTIELEDKSIITLFKNARLQVTPGFNDKTRTVRLEGDARFDIAKNPDKPFIILNKDIEVEVLGTSFTIQQRADFNTTYVHSGKVKASYQNQSVVAVAQQKIVKDNQTGQLSLVNLDVDVSEALLTQTIRCRDIRIDSLSRLVEELYNIRIEFSPSIAARKITSTYLTTETPDQVVENIALTLDANWTKKENHYTIYK